LHESGERSRTIHDLALLCSNCHHMIHRKPPWPTPSQLRGIIRMQSSERHSGRSAKLCRSQRGCQEAGPLALGRFSREVPIEWGAADLAYYAVDAHVARRMNGPTGH